LLGQAQNISTNNQESDRKKIPPNKKFLIMLCSAKNPQEEHENMKIHDIP
jgi:hypothetical protein